MQMNEYSHTHNLSQQLGGQQPRTMMMSLGQQPMMSSLSQPQHPGSQQQQQQPQPQQQQRLPQQQPTSVGAPPGSSSGSRPLQSISSLSRQPSLGPATSALPAQQQSLQRQTSNPLSGVHPLNTINGQSIQQGQKWPGQDGSMSGVPSGALFSMGQGPSPMGGGMHPGYHSSDMVNLLKGGYAHVATGMNAMPQMNNDGPRFDMANDFPSLGDVVGKSSSHHSQSSTSSQPAPSPTHNTQFAIQNEDFPSLQSTLSNPSSLLSPSNQAPQSSSLSTSDPSLDQNGDFPHLKDAMQRTGYTMQPQRRSGNQAPQQPQRPPGPNQGQGQVPNYATSAMPSQSLMSNGSNPSSSRNSSAGSSASSTGIPPSSASSILSSSTSTSAAASPMSSGISLPDGTRAPVIASSSSANTAGMDRYGLTGLLSVIRMTDPDLNTLALGTDLTTLGLNLNSTEVLYATFAYPCLDTPTRRDPDYVLPYCYYMQPPALKTSHLSKFQLETLFYIFYNMPKDTLQVYAAKELYNRDWRYHKEMKLWFTRANDPKANPPDMGNGLIYFDCTVWERAIFRDTHLLAGVKFMTEEELAGLL